MYIGDMDMATKRAYLLLLLVEIQDHGVTMANRALFAARAPCEARVSTDEVLFLVGGELVGSYGLLGDVVEYYVIEDLRHDVPSALPTRVQCHLAAAMLDVAVLREMTA